MKNTCGSFIPDERGVETLNPLASPRFVRRSPFGVVAAVSALTPGRTTYGISNASNASTSSESRPKSPASPPLRRTTRLPFRTSSQIIWLLNPGDECIIPVPAFPLYESITVAAGAVPKFLDLKKSNFQIEKADLEALITEKTKAIVLNSPNNPTGCVLSWESLNTVAELAQAHDFYILCDNVYAALSEEVLPDLTLRNDLRERVILCQSFSKPWAMTGWRLGWLAAPAALVDKFTLLQAAQIASVPTFLQKAAETALTVGVADMAHGYRKRREYMLKRLDAMGLTYPRPEGAFYVFPDISKFGMDSETFCIRLIQEGGLAAVPGSCFGGEGHIRLSLNPQASLAELAIR